jgi:hypothetical protein
MIKSTDDEPIEKFSVTSALIALAICGVVSVGVYFTNSGWALLGLLLLDLTRGKKIIPTNCQGCRKHFNAVPDEPVTDDE